MRLAAVESAARFGGERAVAALLTALNTAPAEEAAAIQNAPCCVRLATRHWPPSPPRFPRQRRRRACAAAMLASQRPARKRCSSAPPTPSSVRIAALQALGVLTEAQSLPRVVELLVKAPEGAEAAAAEAAVVAACRRLPEADARAAAGVAALGKATGAGRARLLAVLPQVGGKPALEALIAETKSADANTRDAAIQALAAWPDAAATGELLALAKNADSVAHRAVALRGYLRLIALPADRPVAETVHLYQNALPGPRRGEEARCGRLAGVRDRGSELVALSGRPGVGRRGAAMKNILPRNDQEEALQGDDVVEVVRRVAVVARDGEVRTQAYAYLASLPAADDPNLAQGKPVVASVDTEGDHRPERAVDGNWRNRDGSAWFGNNTPAWLRVDLGKPERIDTAHVYFYWDGARYYQYTLDVSTDLQTWQTVVDARDNTTPATPRGVVHTFEPVEARYVRLNVLKNSANRAVHVVELKLYAPGTAPAPQPAPQPDAEGFVPLFNGKDLTGWTGSVDGYVVENGAIVCIPEKGGVLHTEEQYADFHLKFEVKLVPGANNGIGIRFDGGTRPTGHGDPGAGHSAESTRTCSPTSTTSSWRGACQAQASAAGGRVERAGDHCQAAVTVILNGVTIVDADLDEVSTPETMDHQPHPGLKSPKGYIGFLGHGTRVEFRNIRIKDLSKR